MEIAGVDEVSAKERRDTLGHLCSCSKTLTFGVESGAHLGGLLLVRA